MKACGNRSANLKFRFLPCGLMAVILVSGVPNSEITWRHRPHGGHGSVSLLATITSVIFRFDGFSL